MENLAKIDTKNFAILIVDDNPTNLSLLADYLKEYNFKIFIARSGQMALKRVQHAKPDIILLDVMMSGMDGFETCQLLKENVETKDIPVIFMTALHEVQHKVKAFELGAVDYITKPFQRVEVLARISTHLNIRTLNKNLQESNQRLRTMTGLLSKRAVQLEASSEVASKIISILDVENLLSKIVELIHQKFDYYFVGIWLLSSDNDKLLLQAGASFEEVLQLEIGLEIPVNPQENIPAWVVHTGHAYLTGKTDLDTRYLFLKLLPHACSEMALPLRFGHQMMGVLDIYSDELQAFQIDDRVALQMLANQIAIAIRNARLYQAR